MTPAACGQYPRAGVRLPRRGVAQTAGSSPAAPSGPVPVGEDPIDEASGHRPGQRLALVLATAGGAGYAPVAPGTFGSAVGVLAYLPLAGLGPPGYGAALAVLLVAGIWAADGAERAFGQKDDGRIVIDEVVGQLVTLAPLVWLAPRPPLRSPLWLVTGFVAFRCLDIWKPGPVRWAERRFTGGAGVVLDDAVAGLLGAALLGAAAVVARAIGEPA